MGTIGNHIVFASPQTATSCVNVKNGEIKGTKLRGHHQVTFTHGRVHGKVVLLNHLHALKCF